MGDVWAGLSHFEAVEACRSRVDGRRMLLECPSSQEWYFGERVRDWRTVPLASRPIPEHVPLLTFWPDYLPPLDYTMYLRGEGAVHATHEGDYLRFIREDLLPSCPFIHPEDPPQLITDTDHDSDLVYLTVGAAEGTARSTYCGREGLSNIGLRGRVSRVSF